MKHTLIAAANNENGNKRNNKKKLPQLIDCAEIHHNFFLSLLRLPIRSLRL